MEGSDPSNRWSLLHHITTWGVPRGGIGWKRIAFGGKKVGFGLEKVGPSVPIQTHPVTWLGEFVVYWIM